MKRLVTVCFCALVVFGGTIRANEDKKPGQTEMKELTTKLAAIKKTIMESEDVKRPYPVALESAEPSLHVAVAGARPVITF